MARCIGWDIGGAHLKAVYLDVRGDLVDALQLPCALWRGLDRLEAGIGQVLATFRVNANEVQHAITMTGELVDLFANRPDGVLNIAAVSNRQLGRSARYYAAKTGFVGYDATEALHSNIASANWHASASLIGRYIRDAVVVDMGSTTTDIIPINNGKVALTGMTDAQRMREDTLVYTGVIRTPVMALANKLMFEGAETNVAAEYFATMADVYRLTGELALSADTTETADGRAKTVHDSARRLARMIGYDLEDRPLDAWRQLARECRQIQESQLLKALQKQLTPADSIIGVGAGAFLVESLARSKDLPYKRLEELIPNTQDSRIGLCFPAYAVARLVHLESMTL